MGPRLEGRGELPIVLDKTGYRAGLQWGRGWKAAESGKSGAELIPVFLASMGPRLEGRGENNPPPESPDPIRLQWGRGWKAAERGPT